MASSSSLFNFISFLLLPSQITKKNQPQIISTPSYCDSSLPNLSYTTTTINSSSVSFLNRRNRDGFVPITPIQKSSSSSSSSSSENDDVFAVICPSLAYSNTLYCSPYYFEIYEDDDEPVESLILRFRRSVLRAGVIQEAKRRRYHETSQEKRKRKSREAARRNRRRRIPWRGPREDVEALKEVEEEEKKKAKDDDQKDNWEYYEGGIPYY